MGNEKSSFEREKVVRPTELESVTSTMSRQQSKNQILTFFSLFLSYIMKLCFRFKIFVYSVKINTDQMRSHRSGPSVHRGSIFQILKLRSENSILAALSSAFKPRNLNAQVHNDFTYEHLEFKMGER